LFGSTPIEGRDAHPLNHAAACAFGGCVHTQAQDDATCQTGEIDMKLITLSLVALALSASTSVAYAADESDPPLPRFRPWQQAWQCNDIRVTVTARDPFSVEYDLGGTIWGGSRFNIVKGALYFNGRPCLPLQPVGY
jgi:hypothetical protein